MTRILSLIFIFLAYATIAYGRDIKLTIYDDGVACPGNCDAHVVLNNHDNGTRYAYRLGATRSAPQACIPGHECEICFGEADTSCMVARYRGGGPPVGTFDFTPAFYQVNCGKGSIPLALRRRCGSLDRAVRAFGYDARVNCFTSPQNPKCDAIIAASRAAQQADVPKRQACLREGEPAYNQSQVDPNQRRALNCNYSQLSLGGSGAKRWRLLLPAACRAGTSVDKFGLDCCSADVRFAASNHPECAAFYPR